MALFEHFWDCPSCGRKGISALRLLKCPSCGYSKTPQDKEHHSQIEITDEVGIALANNEPHWTCSSCGSVNLATIDECLSCGSPMEDSDPQNRVIELGSTPPPEYTPPGEEQWYESNTSGEIEQESPNTLTPASSLPTTKKQAQRFGKPWLFLFIATAALSTIFGVWWIFFHTTQVEAQVVGFSWTREVKIERYQTVHESGWSSPPVGAYHVDTSTRFHHYEPIYEVRTKSVYQSRTCYRDNGNGSSSSYECGSYTTQTEMVKVGDRPVYQTWYEYDIDKWLHERTEKAEENDHSPYWPEYRLNLEGQTALGAERVGSTPQTYTVIFQNVRDVEKTYRLDTSEEEWQRYSLGDTYPLKVNRLGTIRNNPLKDKEGN